MRIKLLHLYAIGKATPDTQWTGAVSRERRGGREKKKMAIARGGGARVHPIDAYLVKSPVFQRHVLLVISEFCLKQCIFIILFPWSTRHGGAWGK